MCSSGVATASVVIFGGTASGRGLLERCRLELSEDFVEVYVRY